MKVIVDFNKFNEDVSSDIIKKNRKLSDNTISIVKGKSDRYRSIYSNSKWFDDCEWFQIIDKEDYLIIKKCLGIEIPKSAKKFTKSRRFTILSEIPIGQYDIDESESNTDELFIPIS